MNIKVYYLMMFMMAPTVVFSASRERTQEEKIAIFQKACEELKAICAKQSSISLALKRECEKPRASSICSCIYAAAQRKKIKDLELQYAEVKGDCKVLHAALSIAYEATYEVTNLPKSTIKFDI